MLKHTNNVKKTSSPEAVPVQDGELEELSSFSSESSVSEEEGLARHVWESYTNSMSSLNQTKEKILEKIASPRSAVPLPHGSSEKLEAETKECLSETTGTGEASKDTKNSPESVPVLSEKNSKETESKDPESLGTKLVKLLGSKAGVQVLDVQRRTPDWKVNVSLVFLFLLVCFLLYLVLLILTIKAASCVDKLVELAELARMERKDWIQRIKTN